MVSLEMTVKKLSTENHQIKEKRLKDTGTQTDDKHCQTYAEAAKSLPPVQPASTTSYQSAAGLKVKKMQGTVHKKENPSA